MSGFVEGIAKFKVIQNNCRLLICFHSLYKWIQRFSKSVHNISTEVKMGHDLLNKQEVLLVSQLGFAVQTLPF